MYVFAEDGFPAGFITPSGKELQCTARSCCPLWMWGQHIFTWQGEHVGYWVDGWVRDHDGRAIAWSEKASGPPGRPNTQPLALKLSAGHVPTKVPSRGALPPKPEWKGEWSPVSAHDYLTMFIDEGGESVPVGVGVERFRAAARARMADRPPAAAPESEPERAEESAPDAAPADVLLAELNAAIRAYASVKAEHDVRRALYRLTKAATKWARERGTSLRSGS